MFHHWSIFCFDFVEDIPVFEASQTEDEEWREFTLSGANPAYSSNDPRVQTSPSTRKNSFEKGCLVLNYKSNDNICNTLAIVFKILKGSVMSTGISSLYINISFLVAIFVS
jgi:hypothetical protein